MHDISQLLLSS